MKRLLLLALLPMLLAGCEPNQSTDQKLPSFYSAPSWAILSEATVNSTFKNVYGKSADGVLTGIYTSVDDAVRKCYLRVVFDGQGALAILDKRIMDRPTIYNNLDEFFSWNEDIKLFPTKQQLCNLKSQTFFVNSFVSYIFSALKNFTITADKRLWGLEAGSNLIDMFEFQNWMPRIDYQTFEVYAENLTTHTKYGAYEIVTLDQMKGSLLPEFYIIKPKKAHEERYDQVTFCVTIESEVEDTTITRTQTFVVNF